MNQRSGKPVWIKYDLFSRLDEFHQLSGGKSILILFDRPLVVVCIFSHKFQAKTPFLFLFCLLSPCCEGGNKNPLLVGGRYWFWTCSPWIIGLIFCFLTLWINKAFELCFRPVRVLDLLEASQPDLHTHFTVFLSKQVCTKSTSLM